MTSKTDLQVVVDTQWLGDRLDDPSVRIVEVEMNSDRYKEARIPGAVFWNITTDLLLPNLRMNLDVNGRIDELGEYDNTTSIMEGICCHHRHESCV